MQINPFEQQFPIDDRKNNGTNPSPKPNAEEELLFGFGANGIDNVENCDIEQLNELNCIYESNEIQEDKNETSADSKNVVSANQDETSATVALLEAQVQELQNELNQTKKDNGWISGAWDWFKNTTGIGASSNKAQKEIDALNEQIKLLKDGSAKVEDVLKNISGKDFSQDDYELFLNGEMTLKDFSKAGEKVNGYTEGQKMVVDTVADITSGIVSVGAVALCSAVGICAAPFTAGASLGMVAAGFGIAAATGAVVKVGIKASDCIGSEKEYSLKDAAYDTVTGGVNGAVGIFSNGLGATVGKGIMKKAGMEALETTVKSGFKVGATKVVAKGADMAVDGAMSGLADSLSRDIGSNAFYGENKSIDEILSNAMGGTVGGLIASPIIGGGMNVMGKAGGKLGSKIMSKSSKEAGEAISGEISEKIAKEAPVLKASAGAIDDEIIAPRAFVDEAKEKLGLEFDKLPKEISENSEKLGEFVQFKTMAEKYLPADEMPDVAELADAYLYDFASKTGEISDIVESLEKNGNDIDSELFGKIINTVDGAKQNQADLFKARLESKKYSMDELLEYYTLADDEIPVYQNYVSEFQDKNLALDLTRANLDEVHYQRFLEYKNSDEMVDDTLGFGRETLKRKKYNDHNALDIAKMDDIQYERFLECDKKGYSLYYSIGASQLDDVRYQRFLEYSEKLDSDYEAFEIAQLDDEKYLRYQYCVSEGVENALYAAQLEGTSLHRFWEYRYNKNAKWNTYNYNDYQAYNIAKMSDVQFERFKKYKDTAYALEIGLLDDSAYSKFEDCTALGVETYYAKEAASYDEKMYDRFVQSKKMGTSDSIANISAYLDETKFDRFKTQMGLETDENVAYNIAVLDDTKYALFGERKAKLADSKRLLTTIDYSETQFDRYIKSTNLTKDEPFSRLIALLDDDSYGRFVECTSKDTHYSAAYRICKEDSEKYAKFMKCKDLSIDDTYAQYAINLEEKEFSRFIDLVEKDVSPTGAYQMRDINDVQYSQFFELKNKGLKEENATTLAFCVPEYHQKTLKAIDDGIGEDNIYRAINLGENQYDDVLRYKKAGFAEDDTIIAVGTKNPERYLEYRGNDYANHEAISIANLDETQYSTYLKHCNDEKITIAQAISIAQLNDVAYNKFVDRNTGILDTEVILKTFDFSDVEFKMLEQNYDELSPYLNFDEMKFYTKNGKLGDITSFEAFQQNKELISKLNEAGLINVNYQSQPVLDKLLFGDVGTASLSYREKLNQINYLTSFKTSIDNMHNAGKLTDDELARLNIQGLIDDLHGSLKNTIKTVDVSSEDIARFGKGFLANNNPDLENVLKNANFEKYAKDGIPLEYSRKDFLGDLNSSIKDLNLQEKARLYKKLGITPVENSGEIVGYNGILNYDSLDLNNENEKKIYDIVHKFIKENSAKTGNPELDESLNSLLAGMPEFINVIGKQQHATQAYSVDTHILTVLEECMKNPKYNDLSDLDKTCLKLATILHDISKSEGIVDKLHPVESSIYAKNIVDKLPFSDEVKDRVFELVKNHHWLEGYNAGQMDASYVASMFRRKDDYAIAQIMADSDLKGVSESFYRAYSSSLEADKLAPIQQYLDKINSDGQLLYTSRIIKKDLIPEMTYNGQKYQVVDFTKIPDGASLEEFGFAPEVTKENMRLFIHMSSTENLRNLKNLSDVSNGGFLCASYISLENKPTYWGNKFGVSLEANHYDVANAAAFNQASGCGKDFGRFSKIITGQDAVSSYRKPITDSIKETLNLSDSEYSELYERFANRKYLSQIRDEKVYKIGDKKLLGKDIKDAIKKADDVIIAGVQNEANLYNPSIGAIVAKVDSMDEIPKDLLDFAQENDYPIYILGSK